MRKIKFLAIIMCIAFWGTGSVLSTNAAEMRATPCLNRDCSGIIITKSVDRTIADYTENCAIHSDCIVSYTNIVAHERVTCCSECGTVYKTELVGSTATQMHSNPVVFH